MLNLTLAPSADTSWQNDARCVGVDPEVMQPETASAADVAHAKAFCSGCPVALQCKAAAEAQTDPYGVWAGQWYGDMPKTPTASCHACGKDIDLPAKGWRKFCDATCRQRFHREQKDSTR